MKASERGASRTSRLVLGAELGAVVAAIALAYVLVPILVIAPDDLVAARPEGWWVRAMLVLGCAIAPAVFGLVGALLEPRDLGRVAGLYLHGAGITASLMIASTAVVLFSGNLARAVTSP